MKQELTNKNRFAEKIAIIYVLIWTLIVPIQTFGQDNYLQSQINNVPLNQEGSSMPNLTGNKANEYLKENGLYESLTEAMQAARYYLAHDEQISRYSL